MKALLLAAGFGRRMGVLTKDTPKPLVKVADVEILARIIDNLIISNIHDLVIVTGFQADKIRDFVTQRYPKLSLTFVHNPVFATTNNIYSLYLALNHLHESNCVDDILLIETDLLFKPEALASLLNSPYKDAALVSPYQLGMDGTVLELDDDKVVSVIPPHLQSKNFNRHDKYKTVNIYKFSSSFAFSTLLQYIGYYASNVDSSCYYELILGLVIYMQSQDIHAVVIDPSTWIEVDDPFDLAKAHYFIASSPFNHISALHGGFWNYSFLDFAYIRNLYFPTPDLIAYFRSSFSQYAFNYGSSQSVLDYKLSASHNFDPSHVVVLNGAAQAFPLLAQYFKDSDYLIPAPTFGEYPRLFTPFSTYSDSESELLHTLPSFVSSNVVVLVNPNNPSGLSTSSTYIASLIEEYPSKFFIIDESFIDFSEQSSLTSIESISESQNWLVLKSLSKSLGLPGIRLGYAFSPNTTLLASIRSSIPIWNLNSFCEGFLEVLPKYASQIKSFFTNNC